MDREALNDFPMGRYDVTVTISTFVPDREIAWKIRGQIKPPIGHVYGYTLAPVDDGTLVTSYYDWSKIEPTWREAGDLPGHLRRRTARDARDPRPHGPARQHHRVDPGRTPSGCTRHPSHRSRAGFGTFGLNSRRNETRARPQMWLCGATPIGDEGMRSQFLSFGEELAACEEVSEVLEVVARRAASLVGEGSVLAIVSEDGTTLQPTAFHHDDPVVAALMREVLTAERYLITDGIAGTVVAHRTPIVLHGANTTNLSAASRRPHDGSRSSTRSVR